jgi:putative flippase GtrA
MPGLITNALDFLRQNDLRTIIARMNARGTHPFIQFLKYAICGVGATIVHHGLFFILSYTVIPAGDGMTVNGAPITPDLRYTNGMINNGIAFIPSMLFAYFTNVLWVFTPGRHSRFMEFLLFFVIGTVAFLAGLFGGPMLIKWFGIPTWMSQITFLFTSFAVNFFCRKFFIFKG